MLYNLCLKIYILNELWYRKGDHILIPRIGYQPNESYTLEQINLIINDMKIFSINLILLPVSLSNFWAYNFL